VYRKEQIQTRWTEIVGHWDGENVILIQHVLLFLIARTKLSCFVFLRFVVIEIDKEEFVEEEPYTLALNAFERIVKIFRKFDVG
jgi:hypothetical protein